MASRTKAPRAKNAAVRQGRAEGRGRGRRMRTGVRGRIPVVRPTAASRVRTPPVRVSPNTKNSVL